MQVCVECGERAITKVGNGKPTYYCQDHDPIIPMLEARIEEMEEARRANENAAAARARKRTGGGQYA
jgi:hypothetical protein